MSYPPAPHTWQYRLRRLGMSGTVLHLGAHPDDEDIGLLSYIAHKYCARAVYWSATRGEGGQNRIAPYAGEALGIFRSWEADNAREIDGGECLYGPFIDFGYTKTAEECLQKWGERTVVKEIVRVIRYVQPQVIVARWWGKAEDFHGQHQAVGHASYAAFEAAGDPDQFPELAAEGLLPWQPLKIYHTCDNTGGDQTTGGAANIFGNRNPTYEADSRVIRINTGEVDPLTSQSFQEQAWIGYLKHQSQGIKVLPKRGDFFYYFSLYKRLIDTPNEDSALYDGLDPTLTGLALYLTDTTDDAGESTHLLHQQLASVKACVQQAVQHFSTDPLAAVPALLRGLEILREQVNGKRLNSSLDHRAIRTYLSRKIIEFEHVICHALGLRLEVVVDDGRVTPGQILGCQVTLWNDRQAAIESVSFELHTPESWQTEVTQRTSESLRLVDTRNGTIQVSSQAALNCPYWLRSPHSRYCYLWPKHLLAGHPFDKSLVHGEYQFSYHQVRLSLTSSAFFQEAFPGGYRELSLAVVPPISLQPLNTGSVLLPLSSADQVLELPIIARSNTEHTGVNGQLRLEAPDGWQVEPAFVDVALQSTGSSQSVNFKVTVPQNTRADDYTLRSVVQVNGRDYDVIVHPVRMRMPGLGSLPDESNCINEEFVLSPATLTVKMLNVEFIPGKKYAYVEGVSEQILDALTRFNLDFQILSDAELGFINLETFDAVVIGPNAYLLRDELAKNAARFLDYVKQGGTLIVQHQGYGFQGKGFTPYPFEYAQPHDRVSFEENPSPEILNPAHFLATYPNAIRVDDFLGWHQEVGLYFFNQWDKRYQSVFSCHDPGEPPKHGCMMLANYGQGTYLYSGFSFFRQMPVGTPGAFRLFANMLAIPEARINQRSQVLKTIPLFSSLDKEQLHQIAKIIEKRVLLPGTTIFQQGDQSDEMYFLIQGELSISQVKGDETQTWRVNKSKEMIGAVEVIGQLPRRRSVLVEKESQILALNAKHFFELMHEHADISKQVIQMLVHKLVFD